MVDGAHTHTHTHTHLNRELVNKSSDMSRVLHIFNQTVTKNKSSVPVSIVIIHDIVHFTQCFPQRG